MARLIFVVTMIMVISPKPTFGQKIKYARGAKMMNEFADQWFEGEATYKNGETVLCELSYNPLVPEGLVKIMDGDRILTETAYSLESFTFYDFKAAADHTYYSLQIGSRQRMFIELLHEGPHYSLLGRREILAKKQYRNIYLPASPSSTEIAVGYQPLEGPPLTGPTYDNTFGGVPMTSVYRRTKLEKNYQRYLFDMETGDMHVLGPKEVIKLTEDKKKEVKQFIRANKIKFRATADYIAVLDEYYRLTQFSTEFQPD